MILCDTTILVRYVRGDADVQRIVATIPAAVCGVTVAELLHGTRSPAERVQLMQVLARFGRLTVPDAIWEPFGDALAALRAAGLRLPFADVLIASVAVHAGLELWTRDRHFALMQPALPGLRLFPEPP